MNKNKVIKKPIAELLVEKEFFTDAETAKRAIMAGEVYVNCERELKAGTKVKVDALIEHKSKKMKYVSRGGFKLEKALKVFNIDLKNKLVLDIGSSTGGFTDCSLQSGAKKVYALDVGTNQLAWKLRVDERVVVMEKTNFRTVETNSFELGKPDFICTDVSFISLNLIIPNIDKISKDTTDVVLLIKPQFEADVKDVGEKGIVNDKFVHSYTIINCINFAKRYNLALQDLSYSPIRGGKGNIEYLVHFKRGIESKISDITILVNSVIDEAHEYNYK